MDKKVIVVTGASSGIGAALCKKMGTEGWCIVLAARRVSELEKIAALSGNCTLVVRTDVTKKSDTDSLKEKTLSKFGRIDVWVNNAGRGIGKRVIDLTEQDIDEIMNVNFKSVFFGIQAVVPYFMERGSGHLINISSFLGRVPFATFRSVYNAAKSAVNTLTANLRVDLRRTHPNIHVSLVMPGVVSSEFQKNALYGTPQMPQFLGVNLVSIRKLNDIRWIVGLSE